MLFDSYGFILAFLPLTFAAIYAGARRRGLAVSLLIVASLIFYAWRDWRMVAVLLVSIGFNFIAGRAVAEARQAGRPASFLLIAAIAVDLGVLAFFRYADFGPGHPIAVPLGLAFFTLTQIAFLVDAARGRARESSLKLYTLFVAFFPTVAAGPIVRHEEVAPQMRALDGFRFRADNIAIGLTIFAIGLIKKILLADGIAPYADTAFARAAGSPPQLFETWIGALAFTLQIYFDFSGYADMAIGLAALFNIRLPLNFDSPYKSASIIEFWRRWQMSVSRFLRDYLYIPLGGNRSGMLRRFFALFVTMLAGGIWYGAGWTFVVWGAFNGFLLVLNHAWRTIRPGVAGPVERSLGWLLTFVATVTGFVFFRADSLSTAFGMLGGMAGKNGADLPYAIVARLGPAGKIIQRLGVEPTLSSGSVMVNSALWIFALGAIVLLTPTTQQIMALHPAALGEADVPVRRWRMMWRPTAAWAVPIAALAVIGLFELPSAREFLAFR